MLVKFYLEKQIAFFKVFDDQRVGRLDEQPRPLLGIETEFSIFVDGHNHREFRFALLL